MSTFVTDFPYVDLAQNARLGYRLPIKVIVPSYMLAAPIFEDFFNAIDQVFDTKIYDKTLALSNLRNMWVLNPETEQKVLNEQMLGLEDWSLPEREIVGKQLNLLGLQLGESASLFTDKDFVALCRFLGLYWYEKGMKSFMAFVNFCCGTHYTIANLWTKDYKEFYEEGDEKIGTPIWEGGEWYPTTHVQFTAQDSETNILALALLFKEIANYNLVLNAINIEFNMKINNGHGSNALLLSSKFNYHTTYKISTINEMEEQQKEMFGYEGTKRLGYDLARYAEDDYDDSTPTVSTPLTTTHAFYAVQVSSFPTLQYPVTREEPKEGEEQGVLLEKPQYFNVFSAFGCLTKLEFLTVDSPDNTPWKVEETGGAIQLKYAAEDPFGFESLVTIKDGLKKGYTTILTRSSTSNIKVERVDNGKVLLINENQFSDEMFFSKLDIGKEILIKVTLNEVDEEEGA